MSTNCNGGIVNIPQAFQGEDGISSYVYIAYADNVVLGTPDVVTNFQYGQPDPTSEWIAIITTNIPINNPSVLDFQGYWVKIKGASGVGAAGINLENNNVAVTGGPFTTLNFFAAGLTGVTVSDAGGSQADIEIVTAGLNKRYYGDLLVDIALSNLIPGASYWIVDVGDGQQSTLSDCSPAYYAQTYPSTGFTNYPHTAGIILRAITDSTVDSTGIYLARVPNRSLTTLFTPGTSYTTGDYVENYNEVFELIGSSGSYTINPANDPTNWTFIYKDDTTYYGLEINGCEFDVNTGKIKKRWDNRSNVLINTNNTSTSTNELIRKAFRWGLNDYYNNKINFYDNIGISTINRAPDYSNALPNFNYATLVNYSTLNEFYNNSIDQECSYGYTNSSLKTIGTRFFNVYLPTCIFSNNIIENAVITNLTEDSGLYTNRVFQNNFIKDSVINKFNFQTFTENELTNNSVLGDIYYCNTSPYFAGRSSQKLLNKLDYAIDDVTTGIWNQSIINNLGSKSFWFIAGDATSTATNSGANTLIQLNGASSTHYSAPNDIVLFNNSPEPLLSSTFRKIVTTPSSTSFTVAGNIPGSSTGAFTLHIFHESIYTTFQNFNQNKLSGTVIRGVNKNCTAAPSTFNKNIIENSIIDNYVAGLSNIFGVYAASCDFLGLTVELGGNTSAGGGFSNNKITNSYFYANSINGAFINNEINNAYFTTNGNTGTAGLGGTFSNNIINGTPTVNSIYYFPWVTTAVNFNPSIYISGNNFNATSFFLNNTITNFCNISSCVLNASSQLHSWKIAGDGVEVINGFIYYPGLFSLTLNSSVQVYGIVLTGRNAILRNMVFGSNAVKELPNGSGLPTTFGRVAIRDMNINISSYGNDAILPSLFGSNSNSIRNIVPVEGGATPQTIGTITYQTATYTFTVTTHMPHMINASALSTVTSIGVEGLTINTVAANNAALPANNSPNGNYRTYPTNTGSFVQLSVTVTSITDAYTFVCTASQTTTAAYLLHSTNTVADGQGLPDPGAGVIGPYNEGAVGNETRDNIQFNYWFRNANNAQQSGIIRDTYNKSIITPTYSELTTRIALGLPAGAPPAPPTGSRNYYVYYNYTAATTVLYDSGTLTLTLPKYFELMGGTVIFGSHTAGTYQISTITNMPEGIPIRFVTTVGCAVRFNLVATSALASNRIVQDSAATTYTIQTYLNSSQYAYDEIVLMKQNGVIRIVNKIIHV